VKTLALGLPGTASALFSITLDISKTDSVIAIPSHTVTSVNWSPKAKIAGKCPAHAPRHK
jgi:hypothetical protein